MSSTINGVGTYIQQLAISLAELDISIGILVFNFPCENFHIEEKNDVEHFYFPPFENECIQENHNIIDYFLQLYIPDSADNIFLINYSPCSLLMNAIHTSHPQSRLIYVIHDMAWNRYLFGDVDEYIRRLSLLENDNIGDKDLFLLNSYQEEIRMSELADKIICLSEDTYQLINDKYPIDKNKLILIPNALFYSIRHWNNEEKNKFKQQMYLNENEKILLYVGRLTEQKGVFLYLDAFREILKHYSDCHLIIAGYVSNWNDIQKKYYPILNKVLLWDSYLPKNWKNGIKFLILGYFLLIQSNAVMLD